MAFAPIDPRIPDARRKQLLAKVLQQQSQNRPTVGMPSAARSSGSALAGIGQQMKAGASHLNFTQPQNFLSSLLSRLGAQGSNPFESEVSPGHGMPIPAHSAGGYGGTGGGLTSPPPIPVAPPAGQQQSAPGPYPAQSLPPAAPQLSNPNPAQVGQMGAGFRDTIIGSPSLPSGPSSPGAVSRVANSGVSTSGSLVPLGNGLFYDPHTDTVVGGGGSLPSLGSQTRHVL